MKVLLAETIREYVLGTLVQEAPKSVNLTPDGEELEICSLPSKSIIDSKVWSDGVCLVSVTAPNTHSVPVGHTYLVVTLSIHTILPIL